MLRRGVLIAGCLLFALAVILFVSGAHEPGIIILAVQAAIVTVALLVERFRYKPELPQAPGAGWVRTEEKSKDSKGLITVWFNPTTGERAYVRDS